MTTLTPAQGAAWLQLRIDHDDTAFRRRAGASDALKRLRGKSEALVYRVAGDRIDLLLGRRIGGGALAEPRDAGAVQDFVAGFYREHGALFGGSPLAPGSLRVERVRSGSTTVAEVGQYVDGVPVGDARWTLLFDGDGHLTEVTGAPFDPSRITIPRRPAIGADEAIALALGHEGVAREDADATARLVIDGRANRLVWDVELNGTRRPSLFGSLAIDAHARTVVSRRDRCEHGVVAIPVVHYSHPGGILDSSASTESSQINIDSTTPPPPKPNLPTSTFYSLQRLGSGRARIWNAHNDAGDRTPLFAQTSSALPGYFRNEPGATTNDIFNEQQTYYWAQVLKTHVDEWGREPNAYGHYPVDSARAINAEIVVNGDAAMEDDWSSSGTMGVQHGYFRADAPRSWFYDHPSSASQVPAVFLFNSAGNADSPQFFGPEHSSSYSIVGHEVGHFISWQYGSWSGPLGSSLNEGHSMVLAALLGKQHFPALTYEESAYVTTGAKIGGKQWPHYVYGQSPLLYSAMDCENDDHYYVAWPFVQAMWRLMNNKGPDGDPVWGSDSAAIANTADLFMYGLHAFTADSTMTWDKLCLGLLGRVYDRISSDLEQQPLANTYCGVYEVFKQHALLTRCVNSP